MVVQETVTGSVNHGKAYGVCLCGDASQEREDQPLCTVQTADIQRMSIVCQDGYTLKVRCEFVSDSQ